MSDEPEWSRRGFRSAAFFGWVLGVILKEFCFLSTGGGAMEVPLSGERAGEENYSSSIPHSSSTSFCLLFRGIFVPMLAPPNWSSSLSIDLPGGFYDCFLATGGLLRPPISNSSRRSSMSSPPSHMSSRSSRSLRLLAGLGSWGRIPGTAPCGAGVTAAPAYLFKSGGLIADPGIISVKEGC